MANAIDQLRHQLRNRGYTTQKDSKGHWVVMRNGDLMRTDSGQPITLPSTTSDPRAIKNAAASLRRAGILTPTFSSGGRKGKMYSASSPAAKELHAMLVEVMKEYDLAQVDVYEFADYYHAQHGYPVAGSPQGLVSKFLRGTSGLSQPSYDYLKRTVDAIIDANGKIPRADEIRQMSTTPAPQPEEAIIVTEETQDEGVQIAGETKARFKPPEITLAFEVMQLFYTEERDPDVILDLCRRIAKLELS